MSNYDKKADRELLETVRAARAAKKASDPATEAGANLPEATLPGANLPGATLPGATLPEAAPPEAGANLAEAKPETAAAGPAPAKTGTGSAPASVSGGGHHYKALLLRRKAQRRQRFFTFAISIAFLLTVGSLLGFWAVHLAGQHKSTATVALIPLDSRPVNTDLVQQLAAIAGVTVTIPEGELLDQFLIPSEPQPLYSWLTDSKESDQDITIIHVNELLFGGLLNSREAAQYRQASDKMISLHDYLLQRTRTPSKKTILVYIMPRLLPSQYDEEMWVYEKELPRLSQLKHRLALEPGNTQLTAELAELNQQIPREIIERYETIYVEAYNTGLNLLDWLREGLIDEVVIGLDDSAEFGLNVKAFRDLKAGAAGRNQKEAYFLHGADELTPLIIARHCLNYGGDQQSFTLSYLTPGQEEVILPYEAIPLKENFQEKADYLFAGKSEDSINTVRKKYIYLYTSQEAGEAELADCWKTIRSDKNRPAGALVGLADIAKVNGSWAPFIESAGPAQVYKYVDAYAGWNTAGNSLGTVMAHLLFWEGAQEFSGPAMKKASANHEDLQKLRLLDDYFFQAKVRQELIEWTRKEGFPYLTFGGRWMEANAKLQELMEAALTDWPQMKPSQAAAGSWRQDEAYPYRFTFPWPRSFEIWIQRGQ